MKTSLINLGCARNLVDSQSILGNLSEEGCQISELEESDAVIINTCAFIENAKQESIDAIIDAIELKKEGKIKKIIIAGCLSQRYAEELAEEFKDDIDAIVGVQSLSRENVEPQVQLTPAHFCYLKICESCYNHCHFCIIPKIKGRFISRDISSVVEETKKRDAQGIKELNIIGQDITAYGIDNGGTKQLSALLKEIAGSTENIEWIRLLYMYPAHITDELIDLIAEEPKICRYIDVPLQHISDKILKSMNRNFTRAQTVELIEKIRGKIPGVSLRTSFIVGLPGETDEDFAELEEFVKEMRFDKMGVFHYSREEGTHAYDFDGQVREGVKKERFDRLMKLQRDISLSKLQEFIGRKIKVLVEEKKESEKDLYLGRTEFDAPEVDGLVFISSSKPLEIGELVTVNITDSREYDLIGEVE